MVFDMKSPWILLLFSYLKKNIKISFTIEAPCDVNPCLNEGVCWNFYNETSPFYYCDCLYGYSGQDCQISKINIKFMRNPLLFIKKIKLPEGWISMCSKFNKFAENTSFGPRMYHKKFKWIKWGNFFF